MSNKLMTVCRHPFRTQLLMKGQMDPEEVVHIEDCFTAMIPDNFRNIVYGYAVLGDGSGFFTDFLTLNHDLTSEMINASDQKVSSTLKDIDLKEYGMSDEIEAKLKAGDATWYAGTEELEDGTNRVVIHFTWPNYHFSRDAYTLAWYGYKAENGKFVRDGKTVSEELVKNDLFNNVPGYVELVE